MSRGLQSAVELPVFNFIITLGEIYLSSQDNRDDVENPRR